MLQIVQFINCSSAQQQNSLFLVISFKDPWTEVYEFIFNMKMIFCIEDN